MVGDQHRAVLQRCRYPELGDVAGAWLGQSQHAVASPGRPAPAPRGPRGPCGRPPVASSSSHVAFPASSSPVADLPLDYASGIGAWLPASRVAAFRGAPVPIDPSSAPTGPTGLAPASRRSSCTASLSRRATGSTRRRTKQDMSSESTPDRPRRSATRYSRAGPAATSSQWWKDYSDESDEVDRVDRSCGRSANVRHRVRRYDSRRVQRGELRAARRRVGDHLPRRDPAPCDGGTRAAVRWMLSREAPRAGADVEDGRCGRQRRRCDVVPRARRYMRPARRPAPRSLRGGVTGRART